MTEPGKTGIVFISYKTSNMYNPNPTNLFHRPKQKHIQTIQRNSLSDKTLKLKSNMK